MVLLHRDKTKPKQKQLQIIWSYSTNTACLRNEVAVADILAFDQMVSCTGLVY